MPLRASRAKADACSFVSVMAGFAGWAFGPSVVAGRLSMQRARMARNGIIALVRSTGRASFVAKRSLGRPAFYRPTALPQRHFHSHVPAFARTPVDPRAQ